MPANETAAPIGSHRLDHAARRLAADEGGAIAIIVALSLLVLMGAAAMALDLSQIYLTQSLDQRIADQSAVAAAFAYNQSGSSTATAQAAASSLAVSNGSGSSTVTTTIVSSPSGDGNQAAKVVVQTAVPLSPFGRALTTSQQNPSGVASFSVNATSYAEIQTLVAPCIIALNSGGLSQTGGTTTTASSCAIASGGNITASNGPNISAQAVYAVGTISPMTCGGSSSTGSCIQTTPTANQLYPGSSSPTDPYATSNVFSRMSTVSSMSAANFPSVGNAPTGGTAQACSGTLTVPAGTYGTISSSYYPTCSTINFTGGASTTTVSGSGLSLSGNSVTINFAAGTYKLNGLSAGNSTAVTINMTGNVVLEIWNGITLSGGGSMTFNGTATYDVQGGIANTSSNALVFNNTNSTSPSTFNVAGGIKMTGNGTFPNANYTITSGDGTAGIDIGGGVTVTFGNGSFNIANGIAVGGGSTLTFGSAASSSSVFQVPTVGNSNSDAIYSGGGSTLTIGSFTNIDLNGPMVLTGTSTLGSGIYTINGALTASESGGCCITGTGVQLIASGPVSFGAGYNSVSISAPTAINSTTNGQFSTVAIATESTVASTVSAGASGTAITGALYMPNASLEMSGAGTITGGGNCAEIIASSITVDSGSSMSTSCPNLGNTSSAGSVALVE